VLLTPRDLRLLGLLAAGVTQRPALATSLGLDERTVADALTAAQLALQASDLTATATYAIRTGLRIPPQLGTCSSPATV
jgi:DNA-binding NarL/FixJ family response regulator